MDKLCSPKWVAELQDCGMEKIPFIKLSKKLCFMYICDHWCVCVWRGGIIISEFTDCPLEYEYHTV